MILTIIGGQTRRAAVAISATAAGDRHAFSQLYDVLSPTVFSVCLHVLNNQALKTVGLRTS